MDQNNGVHLTCSTQRHEPVVVDDEQALTNDIWPWPPGTAAMGTAGSPRCSGVVAGR